MNFTLLTKLALFIFFICISLWLIKNTSSVHLPDKNSSESLTIILTDQGFSPAQLKIKSGDQVTFKTTRHQPFWPASDLHPTHTLYPEFDPKEPIPADKSWSFKFTKEGIWQFHDHLSPYFKGTIAVGTSSVSDFTPDEKTCTSVSANNQQCWSELVRETIKTKGISQAFDLLTSLYDKEPSFQTICHELTHPIGQEAYFQFKRDNGFKDFSFSRKTSFCSYGFYHGFIETMLAQGGTPEEGKKFCDYIHTKLSEQNLDIGGACYHGLGHGFADYTDYRDPKNPNRVSNVINLGIKYCSQIAPDKDNYNSCAEGVFNVVANYYINYLLLNKTLPQSDSNPFYICTQQKEVFKGCYIYMSAVVEHMENNDFFKAIQTSLNYVSDPDISVTIVKYISYDWAKQYTVSNSFSVPQSQCHQLLKKYWEYCIIGFVDGLLDYAKPEHEYEPMLAYCQSSLLDTEEKSTCYKEVFMKLHQRYPLDKIKNLCPTVEKGYQKYCQS